MARSRADNAPAPAAGGNAPAEPQHHVPASDVEVLVLEEDAVAAEVIEFLDPPAPPTVPPATSDSPEPGWFERMVAMLVDPRAIQWMLMLGGGLMVLGIIIGLISAGVFKDAWVVAIALSGGSLAILGAGWYVKLRTDYQVAGRALAFLGCVVMPLNLWFYSAHNLVTLDTHLWLPALICTIVYIATVYVLRDPLFLYAVEAGISLTLVLILGQLGQVEDAGHVSLLFVVLGLISIHAERLFPADDGEFRRADYGLPLFWTGQVQLAGALFTLLGSQVLAWLVFQDPGMLGWQWQGNTLSDQALLAGGIWLAGCYAYLYSDLVVRRVGWYAHASALCFVAAAVTLFAKHWEAEGMIVFFAVASLAIGWVSLIVAKDEEQTAVSRAFILLGQLMSGAPVLMGLVQHVRATLPLAANTNWEYRPGWFFVGAMLVVSLTNRALAYLTQRRSSEVAATYFFFSASGVLIGATGLLRQEPFGLTGWLQQAPWLMLIPVAYLAGSRLWRGQSPEEPLARVAHTATVLILLSGLAVIFEVGLKSLLPSQPLTGKLDNLLLGVTLLEASVFYGLAANFRQRSVSHYLAVAAGCGAVWQFLGYFAEFPPVAYVAVFALLGLGLIVAGRVLGWEEVQFYTPEGRSHREPQGPGVRFFQSGCAVLLVASLAALLQGLSRLGGSSSAFDAYSFGALAGTLAACLVALAVAPAGNWRSGFTALAVALAGVTGVTLYRHVDLTGWQKVELFATVVGILLVVAGYVGRFREEEGREDDSVSLGLWIGSLLAVAPVLIAALYHRATSVDVSQVDEIALVSITVLLLLTGLAWQIKSTTLLGGTALAVYLLVLIGQLAWRPNLHIGIYLAIGGGVMFVIGVVLSIYRDRLKDLPDQIKNREGIFRVIAWR